MKRLVYDADPKEGNRDIHDSDLKEKKESRFRKFCNHLLDATKVTTRVLAVAVGVTVMAYGCSGKPHQTGDSDVDNDVPEETADGSDSDAPDLPDILDEDVDDEEMEDCIAGGEILEGEVSPLLSNSETGEAVLDGADSEVSGDIETTVGGEVSGNLLTLGECPEDSNSVAAFGVQDEEVAVIPEYRLDLGGFTFSAEMPSVDDSVCPPPETDGVPVSMFIDETNLAVKAASVGTVESRGEFGFITPLIPVILVDGSEAVSPVALDGSGYSVKTLMIRLPDSALDMGATVYSNTGENILEREINGSVGALDSKVLRMYQMGPGASILPAVNWDTPTSMVMCLRSSDGSPKEIDLVINSEVIAPVVDACGKIFAGFDVDSLTVDITSFSPPHLEPNYSISSSVGHGLSAMAGGNPDITVTFRREAVAMDVGEEVTMQAVISGRVISTDNNPETGMLESISFTLPMIVISDPDRFDYSDACGYSPSL